MYTKIDGEERAGWPAKFTLGYPQDLWKNHLPPVERLRVAQVGKATLPLCPFFDLYSVINSAEQ